MRTTLNLDDDLLAVCKEEARREDSSLGTVVSSLLRTALDARSAGRTLGNSATFCGFESLPRRDELVTDELVQSIRDESGI